LAKTEAPGAQDALARDYADRLILRHLTEMYEVVKPGEIADRLVDFGVSASTVRSLLASNPDKFAYYERRWVPAARIEAMGRPMAEVVRVGVHRFGGPMPVSLLAREIARVYSLDAEAAQESIRGIAASDPMLLLTLDDSVATADMVFVATDEAPDRALALNGVDPQAVHDLQKKLAKVDWLGADAVVHALEAAAPAKAKEIGAVAWLSMNADDPRALHSYDWRSFNGELLSVPGFVYASDGTIYHEEATTAWLAEAAKVAERAKPSIEIEDVAPLELKKADVEAMVKKITAGSESTTAASLLESGFEITPLVKTYPDDLRTVVEALKADPRVVWVGGDRFRKAGDVAEGVDVLPSPFEFVASDLVDEEGELVDVELTDEGLSTSLRKLIEHPLATDVNDEDSHPAPKNQPDSMRLVVKPIHRELGTFPLAQFPTAWFDEQPEVQELVWRTPDGRSIQLWLNNRIRLIFGLLDLWLDQPIESGAVFSVTKTDKPNVYDFEWLDQHDPVVYISSQRMEELREIATHAEGKSTYELVREVMAHWTKGADFLTLLWEVNVVRRTSRRLLASLLSSYACFYQRSGSPVWHYDAKKVEQGFDKQKRKFVKKD
jgi:hypothetical protein